jgi:hypothetical protein
MNATGSTVFSVMPDGSANIAGDASFEVQVHFQKEGEYVNLASTIDELNDRIQKLENSLQESNLLADSKPKIIS